MQKIIQRVNDSRRNKIFSQYCHLRREKQNNSMKYLCEKWSKYECVYFCNASYSSDDIFPRCLIEYMHL